MCPLEILAPVGSYEALEAAVRCGANAVYLGQKNFSARKNSQNFDEQELVRAVHYAHSCGVKVHQALNILVFDHEIADLVHCIEVACRAGVDALIVQDFGVAEIVHAVAPNMPLHASTQMAIHSPAGVRMAEKLGFSRVVLARELSFDEISAIAASTTLELEVFVHGAHCMSVSGQCYMSAAFGGKSGNRGQCAQPCRLPFTVGSPACEKSGEYVLSLKDMSVLKKLPALQRLGIASVKIEGRMKRPEYVAAAVTACKEVLAGKKADIETLQAVFSRSGFTSGYMDGARDAAMFGYRRKDDVVSAADVLKPLKQLYHKQTPLLPVQMIFSMQKDSPVALKVVDGDTVVQVTGQIPSAAFQVATDENTAKKFLSKLGGTPFFLDSLSCNIDDGLMLTASAFNELRREAVEKLVAAREVHRSCWQGGDLPALPEVVLPQRKEIWVKFRTVSMVTLQNLSRVDKAILPAEEILEHAEKLTPFFSKIMASLPRFAFSGEEKMLAVTQNLKKIGISNLYCESIAHLDIGKRGGMKITGGIFLNLANSYALYTAKECGLSAAMVSVEGKLDWDNRLKTDLPLGVYGYGRLPLMAVRNCPIKAQIGCKDCGEQGFLTDRTGAKLPVRCDGQVSYLYNPIPLSMSDRQKELSRFAFVLLDFTVETAREIDKILTAWEFEEALPPPYTRGLYYRGVE